MMTAFSANNLQGRDTSITDCPMYRKAVIDLMRCQDRWSKAVPPHKEEQQKTNRHAPVLCLLLLHSPPALHIS